MSSSKALAAVLLAVAPIIGCADTVASVGHLNLGAVVHLRVAASPADLRPGLAAPEFRLPDATGRSFDLAELLARRPVVIIFYRGYWCPWCRRQLGELSRESRAFDARGVTLVAVSVDPPEDSRDFARRHDITIPLLADADGAVSRIYVGLEKDGTAIPGVYVVGSDGRILARRIGDSAGDRVLGPELAALLDDTLGPSSSPAAELAGGFSPPARWQLRIDGSAGFALELADNSFHHYFAGSTSILAPASKYAMPGVLVRGALSSTSTVDLNATLKLRLPAFGDIGEVYAIPFGGAVRSFGTAGAWGWNAGGSAGIQFAITPTWAPFFELGVSHHHVGPDAAAQELRFFATLGVAWLP